MPVKNQSTLVQKTLDFLTREILSDRLRPNQKISEVAVSKNLGISRSPVREALRILERDGLVTYEPRKGACVADVTPQEADELYLIHGHLMGLAVKLTCRLMSEKDLDNMEVLVQDLDRSVKRNDRHGFLETRTALENLIVERCLSPRLAHLIEVMGYPSARYRAFHVSVPGYMEEVAKCYGEISQAFRSRDDRKAEMLRARIIEIGRNLLKRFFIEPMAHTARIEQAKTRRVHKKSPTKRAHP